VKNLYKIINQSCWYSVDQKAWSRRELQRGFTVHLFSCIAASWSRFIRRLDV